MGMKVYFLWNAMVECENDKAKQFSKFLYTHTHSHCMHGVFQFDESIEKELKMTTRKLNWIYTFPSDFYLNDFDISVVVMVVHVFSLFLEKIKCQLAFSTIVHIPLPWKYLNSNIYFDKYTTETNTSMSSTLKYKYKFKGNFKYVIIRKFRWKIFVLWAVSI